MADKCTYLGRGKCCFKSSVYQIEGWEGAQQGLRDLVQTFLR